MTTYLSRRGFCVGTALLGFQAVSSSAFAGRAEDGTVKLGLVAPMSGPNPSDPEPMDDEVRGVIRKIVGVLGGKEFP